MKSRNCNIFMSACLAMLFCACIVDGQDIKLDKDKVLSELKYAVEGKDEWGILYLFQTTIGYDIDPAEGKADFSLFSDIAELEALVRGKKISIGEFHARDEKWNILPNLVRVIYNPSSLQMKIKSDVNIKNLLLAMEESDFQNSFSSIDWLEVKGALFEANRIVRGINILFSRATRPEYLVSVLPDTEVINRIRREGSLQPYIVITKFFYNEDNIINEAGFLLVKRNKMINDIIIKIYDDLKIGARSDKPNDRQAEWYFMPMGAKDDVLNLPDAALKRIYSSYEGWQQSIEGREKQVKILSEAYERGGKTDENIKKEIDDLRKSLEKSNTSAKKEKLQYEELKARWEAGDFKDTFKERREE